MYKMETIYLNVSRYFYTYNIPEVLEMGSINEYSTNQFEKTIKEYLRQAREKLENDLSGTREAIKLIADERTKDFIMVTDKGLDKEERTLLRKLIINSMYQSFCYGYGIGKIEGKTDSKVFL